MSTQRETKTPTTGQRLAAGCVVLALFGCQESGPTQATSSAAGQLAKAEALIDAFYSFDPSVLEPLLAAAPDSKASLLYYQGWAEGGEYKIVNRGACEHQDEDTVACPITVEDNPVLALKSEFKVTDTFTMTFSGDEITAVETSSNDQPIYYQARDWVLKEMPEVMEGPCQGFFDGGTTPGDCARAMTEGYRLFAESDAFAAAAKTE